VRELPAVARGIVYHRNERAEKEKGEKSNGPHILSIKVEGGVREEEGEVEKNDILSQLIFLCNGGKEEASGEREEKRANSISFAAVGERRKGDIRGRGRRGKIRCGTRIHFFDYPHFLSRLDNKKGKGLARGRRRSAPCRKVS